MRSALDDVEERSSVTIIARGTYIPPTRKPELGERKLYLLIQGHSEMQVKQARAEIQRLLDEETIRIGGAGHGGSFGRYSVV